MVFFFFFDFFLCGVSEVLVRLWSNQIELVIGSRQLINKCVYKCCVGQGWQVTLVWSALGLLFLALRDGAFCMGMKKKCMYHTIEEKEISAALPIRVAGYQPVFIFIHPYPRTIINVSGFPRDGRVLDRLQGSSRECLFGKIRFGMWGSETWDKDVSFVHGMCMV